MARTDLDELRKGLKIDKYNLDVELERQSDKYYEAAEEAAVAVSIKDAAYDNIKTTHAELYEFVRDQLLSENERVTEAMVDATIRKHPKYRDAFSKWNTANRHASKAIAMENAYRQRSQMLRDLVSSYSSGYWNTTSVSGTARRNDENKYEDVKKSMAKKRRPLKLKKKRPKTDA